MNKTILTSQDTQAPDEILMKAVTDERSETALEQLYQRYSHVLRSVISRVIRDDSEVDDVIQDVFVQVWNRSDTYSAEKGKFLGWLIILARRRALDRLRQHYAYNRARDRYEVEHKLPIMEGTMQRPVDRQVCDEDLRKYFTGLLHRLPPNQEQVVQMTYFEGMSQREIAATLALPLGTVKTRIELGMRKLTCAVAPLRGKVL